MPGLDDLKAPGATPEKTAAQKDRLANLVEDGPDLDVDGVVRWRRTDLRDKLKAESGVELHERGVGRYLTSLG